MIHVVRKNDPGFPPDPGRTRSSISNLFVDWSGTLPTKKEVDDLFNPTPAIMKAAAEAEATRLFSDQNNTDPMMILIRRLSDRVKALE